MRGTPHVHSLVWIANDGITEESVNSENAAEQQKVKNLIKKTVSAMLVDKVHLAGSGSDVNKSYREEKVIVIGIHIKITLKTSMILRSRK